MVAGCEKLDHEFGEVDNTPQLWQEKLVIKAKQQATQHLSVDPFIAKLMADYDAQLLEDQLHQTQSIPSGA